jgi:beta-lactamase class A
MDRVDELRARLALSAEQVAATLDPGAVGVSVYDYLSGFSWSRDGGRWFHAASTIKLAILVALFDGVERGRFPLDARLHVRNRFLSAADGHPFRVDAARDADAEVHAAIGRTMRLADLARHMIVTSSNLATNLLLDLITLDEARAALLRRGIEGVDLRRAVEDERAFEAGCSNLATPDGLVALLRAIRDGREFSESSTRQMIEILCHQAFPGGILPGLPEPIRAVARVAHKTGDISIVSHDAGLVYLPGRPPYAVALLTESQGDAATRATALTALSASVFDAVSAAGEAA